MTEESLWATKALRAVEPSMEEAGVPESPHGREPLTVQEHGFGL